MQDIRASSCTDGVNHFNCIVSNYFMVMVGGFVMYIIDVPTKVVIEYFPISITYNIRFISC